MGVCGPHLWNSGTSIKCLNIIWIASVQKEFVQTHFRKQYILILYFVPYCCNCCSFSHPCFFFVFFYFSWHFTCFRNSMLHQWYIFQSKICEFGLLKFSHLCLIDLKFLYILIVAVVINTIHDIVCLAIECL